MAGSGSKAVSLAGERSMVILSVLVVPVMAEFLALVRKCWMASSFILYIMFFLCLCCYVRSPEAYKLVACLCRHHAIIGYTARHCWRTCCLRTTLRRRWVTIWRISGRSGCHRRLSPYGWFRVRRLFGHVIAGGWHATFEGRHRFVWVGVAFASGQPTMAHTVCYWAMAALGQAFNRLVPQQAKVCHIPSFRLRSHW